MDDRIVSMEGVREKYPNGVFFMVTKKGATGREFVYLGRSIEDVRSVLDRKRGENVAIIMDEMNNVTSSFFGRVLVYDDGVLWAGHNKFYYVWKGIDWKKIINERE